MEYYQYIFETPDIEKQEVIIALLTEQGFNGFLQNDESLVAINSVSISLADLKQLVKSDDILITESIVKEENWNAAWEADFEPVKITHPSGSGMFCNIRASFHTPDESAQYEVIITPKMSFGTGHHATTYMMVENMSSLDFANKKIIDFGTGTGVLAILAEKMGAQKIIAIDIDSWSIRNAEENLAINGCKAIQLIQAGNMVKTADADVILANINLNVIVDNLQRLVTAARPGAVLVFSGMLSEDEKDITEHLIANGITVTNVTIMNNWLLIAGIKD